ncbi:MAG: hypothetical protein IKP88_18670 [Lachnospiraceae bacterium]|nr:hypothetical protein [Lachnospiraceae bacterium]
MSFLISKRSTGISVSMLDIGQEESILVRVNNKNILIDTGERKYYPCVI